MRQKLYLKMLFGYLIFGIVSFLIISTFTTNSYNEIVIENEAKNLYKSVNQLADSFGKQYVSGAITLDELTSQLNLSSSYVSSDIWVVSASGNLTTYANYTKEKPPVSIHNFDITKFTDSFYQVGRFQSNFTKDFLTVYAPITWRYNVKGYIFMHKPIDDIIALNQDMVNVSYVSLLIIYLLSFIVLIIFTFVVYKPLQKIAKATSEYSLGNFKPVIHISSNDEIGYVANTLNYMATKLDTFEDDQRKFIANVSHDFRSPLTSIKGYIEALLDGTIPYEMQDKYLNIILNESNRLAKLTNDMLDLNRIGAIGASLELSDFDINRVIRDCVQSCEVQCNNKDLHVLLVLSEEKMYVNADLGKIGQVLYNLLDNAIKFSKNHSNITIETTCKGEKLLVSLKDQGIGIPADSLSNIWNRFYKSDLSRGKDKKGTGLGLSIVKEIIQAHGETIQVVSTEDVGTEFFFTLKLAQRELDS